MHIVAVAWIFVVSLMSLAEATSTQGSVLGAIFTLLLYGALPLSIVLYVMGTPLRRRTRLARESAENTSAPQRDGCGHPAGAAVAAKREEP